MIHCFIATVHTVMSPETAIRAVTILNNKLETREIHDKEMSSSELSVFFPLEIYQFYLAMYYLLQ